MTRYREGNRPRVARYTVEGHPVHRWMAFFVYVYAACLPCLDFTGTAPVRTSPRSKVAC
jgi:hypothetical protein